MGISTQSYKTGLIGISTQSYKIGGDIGKSYQGYQDYQAATNGANSLFFFGSEKFVVVVVVVFFRTSNDRYIKVNIPLKNLDQRPGTLSRFCSNLIMMLVIIFWFFWEAK
jgi:hypothetical protein